MARTIIEIYNEMIAEKETNANLSALQPAIDSGQTLLSDLTSASKVAIWRLIFFVVSVGIWTHEKIFDLHKLEIETRANEMIPGTLRWYRNEALKFQYGDALIWNDQTLKFTYPTGSTGTKLIAQASAIEPTGANNQVRLKVAKLVSDNLVPLSSSEETAFTNYINQIKFAGTNVSVTNINADLLKLNIEIIYNPLILTPTGELISNPGVFPVRDAINNFIKFLPFDGVFNRNKFIDAIQSASGVIDPIINLIEAKTGALPYNPVSNNYVAGAGYLKIDPLFPLTDPAVVTYTAQII
jgi:hypothetical protein